VVAGQVHELGEALGFATASGRALVLNESCPWSLAPPGPPGFWARYLEPLSACTLRHAAPGPLDPRSTRADADRVAHWRPGMRLDPDRARAWCPGPGAAPAQVRPRPWCGPGPGKLA
jgi:hypothetical protein